MASMICSRGWRKANRATAFDEDARTIIDRARLAYRFEQTMDDDLNTPMAIAVLQDMRSERE